MHTSLFIKIDSAPHKSVPSPINFQIAPFTTQIKEKKNLANKKQPLSPKRYIKLALTSFPDIQLLYFHSSPQLNYCIKQSRILIKRLGKKFNCIYIPLRLRMHLISKFLSRLSSRRSKSSGIVCSANLANKISIFKKTRDTRHQETGFFFFRINSVIYFQQVYYQ